MDEIFVLVDDTHSYHHTMEDVKNFVEAQSPLQKQDPEVQS